MPGHNRGRNNLLTSLLAVACLLAGLLTACSSTKPPDDFERPNGVVMASDGSFFVMDFGNARIAHLSPDGLLLNFIGTHGKAANEIYYGWDLAVGADGSLFLGNVVRDNEGTRHDSIKVFSPEGQFLREIGAEDYGAVESQQANLPYGLDVDEAGRVYVADYGRDDIRIFNVDGELLATLPGKGQPGYEFTNPGDVVVDDTRGLMYVTDFTMGSLLQFNITFAEDGFPDIDFIQTIAQYGRENGQLAFPQNLALDEETGTVYIGDMANRRLKAFDSRGNFIANYFPNDVEDWQVLGLAVGSGGRILVSDALNNLIWVFSSEHGPQPIQKLRIQAQP